MTGTLHGFCECCGGDCEGYYRATCCDQHGTPGDCTDECHCPVPYVACELVEAHADAATGIFFGYWGECWFVSTSSKVVEEVPEDGVEITVWPTTYTSCDNCCDNEEACIKLISCADGTTVKYAKASSLPGGTDAGGVVMLEDGTCWMIDPAEPCLSCDGLTVITDVLFHFPDCPSCEDAEDDGDVICCGDSDCEIDTTSISLSFTTTMYRAVYQWHCKDRQCMQDGAGRCGSCAGEFPWDSSDSDTTGTYTSTEGGCSFPQTITGITYPPVCVLKVGNDFACDDSADPGCGSDVGVVGTRCVYLDKEEFSVTFDGDDTWVKSGDMVYADKTCSYISYTDNTPPGSSICSSTGSDLDMCCDDTASVCTCPIRVEIDCDTGAVTLKCQPAAGDTCQPATLCTGVGTACPESDASNCRMYIAGGFYNCVACSAAGWLIGGSETWPSVASGCPERFNNQNGGERKKYLYKDGIYANAGCFALASFRRIVANFSISGRVNDNC